MEEKMSERSRCNFGVADDWYAPARPVDAVTCEECEGEGWLWFGRPGSPETCRGECPECHGYGWIIPDDEPVN